MAKKKITFVLHDESVNTHGFRMLTAGANLTEIEKNPVMLLNHNDWDLPIGRWDNVRKEGGKILADAVFDLKDERAKVVAQKVEDGFIRAASIGAWPPEAISEAPEDLLPGQTRPTVTKWTPREASICTIGANHNALVLYDREGELIDLSDESNFIKLSDKPFILTKSNTMFKELYSILKLQDGASEGAVQSAVQAIINENVTLKDTNQGLTGQVQNLKDEVKQLKDADKERKDADAIALVDAAIADGRFNAGQKDFLLEMFDKDFEKAKGFLGEPAKGGKVIDQIQQQKKDSVKLFDGKSWNELDKEGLLIKLKDTNIDLFKQKYKAQFGVDYQE